MKQAQQPHPRTTFRRRLTVATTLLFCGVLLLTGMAIYFSAAQIEQTNLNETLLSIARAEIASSTDGPNGKVHIHEEGSLMSPSVYSGIGYLKHMQILDTQGKVILQTVNLGNSPPLGTESSKQAHPYTEHITFANIVHGGESLRCVYYPFHDAHNVPMTAVIALSRSPIERQLRTLLLTLIAAFCFSVGLAAIGVHSLAKKITHPLQAMADAVHEVGGNNLSLRIPPNATDRELHEVASGINRMLDRLETAFSEQQSLIASQRQFVADASHELRSPLSNLRGTVEVALRRKRSPEDYRATLEVALAETERLSRLVNDLLTLSRVDAGQFHMRQEPCDLLEVVCASLTGHKARAAEAKICLSLKERFPVTVLGDSDRLRQVVDNLLDNALRYSPAGATVTLSLTKQNDSAVLSVQDSGEGLPEDIQAHIFDRFYRADSARARHSGGAGLGLSITRAIVELHGGHISVSSVPGQGATFTVSLPLV